jgi:hypothetical protein
MNNKSKNIFIKINIFIFILFLYAASYYFFSRRGFAVSDRYNIEGFYFLKPFPTMQWRIVNYSMIIFYYPLILIDNSIGTGRCISKEPQWKL